MFKFQGGKAAWMTSETRMQLIRDMPKKEICKRRFEKYRPDLYEFNEATGKYEPL